MRDSKCPGSGRRASDLWTLDRKLASLNGCLWPWHCLKGGVGTYNDADAAPSPAAAGRLQVNGQRRLHGWGLFHLCRRTPAAEQASRTQQLSRNLLLLLGFCVCQQAHALYQASSSLQRATLVVLILSSYSRGCAQVLLRPCPSLVTLIMAVKITEMSHLRYTIASGLMKKSSIGTKHLLI